MFRSWGRVGTVIGSNKLEQMPSKEDAIEHFLNLYEEKTGNSWHSKNFTKYPKKFYPLEIDYGQVMVLWLKSIKYTDSIIVNGRFLYYSMYKTEICNSN